MTTYRLIIKQLNNLNKVLTPTKPQVFSLLALFTAALAVLTSMIVALPINFSLRQGDALVQGTPESGYEFVGYIVSDKNRICAGTLLNQDTIISAAHCLAETAGDNFQFGIGEFSTDQEDLANILAIRFANNYDFARAEGADIAVAKLDRSFKLDAYPTLSSPTENCNAKLVAYGAGVASLASADMFQKKSGNGCIKAINDSFLIRFGKEVGMCFGDSGGPIFANSNSYELIGILSGGIVETKLDELKCEPGNTGYAINVNSFTNLIDTSLDKPFDDLASANTRIIADIVDVEFSTSKVLDSDEELSKRNLIDANVNVDQTRSSIQRVPASFYWQFFGVMITFVIISAVIIKYL